VTQCGWVGVPPVTASSAAASRRVSGEAAGAAYRIVHASRIASSISRSVTLFTPQSSGIPGTTSKNQLENRQGPLHIRLPGNGMMVRHKKTAQVQGYETVQGTINLRMVAVDTLKSFATRTGLKPALTAARTMLALAGGMSGSGQYHEQSMQLPSSSAPSPAALSGCCRSLLKPDQFRAGALRQWRRGSGQSGRHSQAGRYPARDREGGPAACDAVPGNCPVRMADRTG
jgi:hypothetical protein